MAEGVLQREWDGFNCYRFHCSADTVAPEWKSSLFTLCGRCIRRKDSWVSVLWSTTVVKFIHIFKYRCCAGVAGSKAAYIFVAIPEAAAAAQELLVFVRSLYKEVLESYQLLTWTFFYSI